MRSVIAIVFVVMVAAIDIDGDIGDRTAARTDAALPPQLIRNPGSIADYARAKRTCTGMPCIAVSRGGRLWAAWFSGTTPGEIIERCPQAYVVVSTSGDGGRTWDDGNTWSGGLVIDERVGCSHRDAQQAADGTIHLIWDFNRSKDQEILMTTFCEEDILFPSAEARDRVTSRRRIVSKGGTPER